MVCLKEYRIHLTTSFELSSGLIFIIQNTQGPLACSGSIVVTTLDCGRRFLVRVPSGCQYSMRLDRLHRAYPSLHPFGVVHWVPVLSNIKTATGCESNRQLQLWTVFAGTVVNNYQQRYSRMGWTAMSNKMPGCHLANAWRSCSKHILQWRYYTAMKYHHASSQTPPNTNTSHQYSKNYTGFQSNKELITNSVFSHTKHLQINNQHIFTIVFHFLHILFLQDLLIHSFFPFHMFDHHLAKGLSLSSVHVSGIHSLLIPETRLLYQYSVPGSKHTSSKLLSLPRLFPISLDCLPGFWFLLFSFYALSNDT